MRGRRHARSWKAWLVAGVVALAVVLVGGPYVYIHFVEGKAPAPLALAGPSASTGDTGTSTSTGGSGGTDGIWKVSNGSLVGYRVKEVLFGQNNVAVGRTSAVTGSITVDGASISAGTFTVDMTSVASDQSRRDVQFNGRIMDTVSYPTATFTLTKAIDLGSGPAQGTQRTYEATGTLTLHGVTRTVTFKVTGRYTGSAVQVAGSIPITFAEWNIPNPSFGPVTTEDHGVLEFSLSFTRSA
jgi:polyisoprenoid-binding protein YceI